MDHHCPWVNNCVGENNQKFFVLFTVRLIYLDLNLFCITNNYFFDLFVVLHCPALYSLTGLSNYAIHYVRSL